MHQGRRRTTSVRAHRLSQEKAAIWPVYGWRSYGRYKEGPLEPQATHCYGIEGPGPLRQWKELLLGNRYCPLLLREQRAEKKILPDCAPTQEPKAEKNRTGRKPLD